MSFDPLYAAPCRAVSPLAFTPFTSLPSSKQSLTAASASSFVPALSPTRQMPTPAAAIIGVVSSQVLREGSAPPATSSRMYSVSPSLAAARKGVEPIRSRMLRAPSAGSPFCRAFGSAP